MSRQPPPKPDVSITPKPRKPSEWSPRPIPTPGVGRSTEDPRTPTLKELAARVAQASLVAGPTSAAAVGSAAGAVGATAPLDCRQAWEAVMRRTRAVLGAGDPSDSRPRQYLDRNRAISAAYAELAQGDPRMRWAGVASVVSTQAHCAMEDANTAVARADAARDVAPHLPPPVGPVAGPAATYVYGSAVEVQRALYDTNREIFSDIYPAVAMYKAHGMDGVGSGPGQCGGARPDRQVAPQLQAALRDIDDGRVATGSRALADYEQTRIVQRRIYDDPNRPLLRQAMRLNQTVSDVPVVREAANLLMKARRPEVAISTDCGRGTPVPFRGDITVADDRVNYYDDLMTQYLRRDQAARDAMGQVIRSRDPLRGGGDYGPPRMLPPTLRWPPRIGP